MESLEKILVYVADSGRNNAAVKRAVRLSKSSKASITLLSVVDDTVLGLRPFIDNFKMVQYRKEVVSELKDHLDSLATAIRSEGIKVTTHVRSGRPSHEIVNHVMRNGHDLVLKTAEGEQDGPMLGSVAMRLLRLCPCPVWVVKPRFTRRYRKMLVAIDPVPGDKERNALNDQILETAKELAATEKCELHIVHSYKLPSKARASAFGIKRAAEWKEVRKSIKDYVYKVLEKHGMGEDPSAVHVLQGEPESVIPKLVMKEGIELLVMGTVARSGVQGLLVGNTAERLLPQVNCSVLAVKPEGFESPLAE